MPPRKKTQAGQMLPLDLPLNGCVALGKSLQGSEPGFEVKEVTVDRYTRLSAQPCTHLKCPAMDANFLQS